MGFDRAKFRNGVLEPLEEGYVDIEPGTWGGPELSFEPRATTMKARATQARCHGGDIYPAAGWGPASALGTI